MSALHFPLKCLQVERIHLAFFAFINNDNYKRTQSLQRFADGTFRQDIISNDLGSWIMTGKPSILPYFKACFLIGLSHFLEYRKAFAALGSTPTDDLYVLYRKKSPLWGITEEVLRDMPSVSTSLIVTIFLETEQTNTRFTLPSSC